MSLPSYWDEFRSEYATQNIEVRRLRASDGHPLSVFDLGRGHPQTVLIINPLATTFLLMLPLAMRLARHFRVVSWELRGAPFLDDPRVGCSVGVDRHAEDLVQVAQQLELERFHALTWCSGSVISAWAAANLRVAFRTVSMVSPDRISHSEVRTPFQTGFVPQLMRIADDRDRGVDVFRQCAYIRQVTQEAHERRGLPTLLRKFTGLPYRSEASVVDYCALVRDFERSVEQCPGPIADPVALFQQLQSETRVLLLHCMDDPAMDYRCTVDALETCRKVKLTLYPEGGHFAPYTAPEPLFRDIAGFIDEGSRA